MRKLGKGPRELKVLGRTIITARAELDWQRERQAETVEIAPAAA